MFVLMPLINLCLRSVFAPFSGIYQPWVALTPMQTHPLVTIPAPTLRHLV